VNGRYVNRPLHYYFFLTGLNSENEHHPNVFVMKTRVCVSTVINNNLMCM
jgi:hypothetical protein